MPEQPRADWMPRSVVSGFCATALMLAALLLSWFSAVLLARLGGGPWLTNLADNGLVTLSLGVAWVAVIVHFFIGIAFAVLYGGWAEPRLRSFHSWQKGLLFAGLPFLGSVLCFFPLVGAGFLGFSLEAGPLPLFGNLVLHAIYGLALGILYGPVGDLVTPAESTVMQPDSRLAEGALRGGARGILIGGVLGLAVAALVHLGVGSDARILGYPMAWLYATCLMFGAPMGYLVGVVVNQPLTSSPTPQRT